jgi:hypothetical protein
MGARRSASSLPSQPGIPSGRCCSPIFSDRVANRRGAGSRSRLLDAVGRTSRSPGPARNATYALDLCGEIGETTAQEMRDLRLDEAAAVLCVSPDTLRAWEQRFGYPHSVVGAAGERRYAHGEVIALRDSLEAGLSIASAIKKARAAGTDSQTPSPQ